MNFICDLLHFYWRLLTHAVLFYLFLKYSWLVWKELGFFFFYYFHKDNMYLNIVFFMEYVTAG